MCQQWKISFNASTSKDFFDRYHGFDPFCSRPSIIFNLRWCWCWDRSLVVKKSRKTILGNSWKKLVIKKAHHQTSANLMDSLNPGHSPPVTPGVPSRLWCQPLVLLGVLVVARYVAPPPSDHDTQSVSGCKRGNGVNQSSPNISQTASWSKTLGKWVRLMLGSTALMTLTCHSRTSEVQ